MYFKPLLAFIFLCAAAGVEDALVEGSPKEGKLAHCEPAGESLQVGEIEREQKDLDQYARLLALLSGIPLNGLSDFLKNKKDSSRVSYMQHLKQKELVQHRKPELFKSEKVLSQAAIGLSRVLNNLSAFGVEPYMAEEFFMTRNAYAVWQAEVGSMGVHIKPLDAINKQADLENYGALNKVCDSYIIVELHLNLDKFEDKTDRGLTEMMKYLSGSLPIAVIANTFGTKASSDKEQLICYDLLPSAVKKAIEKGEQCCVVRAGGEVIFYFIGPRITSNSSASEEHLQLVSGQLREAELQKIQTQLLIESDGGFVRYADK